MSPLDCTSVRHLRTTISFIVTLCFVVACSRTVRVTDEQLVAPSQWEGTYRITTTQEQILAWKFSIADSTLIVTELAEDKNARAQRDAPIVVALADVQSVERIDMPSSKWGTAILVGAVVAVIVAVAVAVSNISIE